MYRVRLLCGHTTEVKALSTHQNGLTEKCPIHDAYFDVKDYTQDEWHSRCKDCSYGARHGQARVYAENATARHRLRYPTHRTYVQYYNVTPASEVDSGPALVMLPGFNGDDTPPPY